MCLSALKKFPGTQISARFYLRDVRIMDVLLYCGQTSGQNMMMIPFLSYVGRAASPPLTTKPDRSELTLINQISVLLALLPVIYIFANVYNQGWSRITFPVMIQPLLFLTPILFNRMGLTVASRVWLCWSMPCLAIFFSVYNKTHGMDIQTSHYMGIRFSILASVVIPFLVFRLKDLLLIIVSISLSLFALMAFDSIHEWFQVGYDQMGLKESGYSLTAMRVMIAFLLIAGSSIFLKVINERNEALNQDLISELTEKNMKIQSQLEKIIAQNQQISDQKGHLEKQYAEIVKQRNKLNRSEKQLSRALETIQIQQEALLTENKSLEFEVLQKNKELSQTNREIIRYNHELHQFSHAVSHNLRGPVARILGLLNIFDIRTLDGQNATLIDSLKKTVLELDDTTKDLNRIMDIRNVLSEIRQPVHLETIIDDLKKSHQKDIEQFGILFNIELGFTSVMFSIPNMVNSIIHNLINNAIKYRSAERTPEIRISCTEEDHYFLIKIRDNGIGLDLDAYREKLFHLYQRFNEHTEGKGLGLYLVRIQTEILGGRVEVKSEINSFTEFAVYLPGSYDPE